MTADRDNNLDVRIQWHDPDQMWAAVLLRDGQEWYLDGALVGMGSTHGEAVSDLVEIAEYLVIHGENALSDPPPSLEDRIWIFDKLDFGDAVAARDTMYKTLRDAGMPGLTT